MRKVCCFWFLQEQRTSWRRNRRIHKGKASNEALASDSGWLLLSSHLLSKAKSQLHVVNGWNSGCLVCILDFSGLESSQLKVEIIALLQLLISRNHSYCRSQLCYSCASIGAHLVMIELATPLGRNTCVFSSLLSSSLWYFQSFQSSHGHLFS